MRTVLLASLRTHTRRYVAAALAVAIGVAFVVTTGILSSATKDGMVSSVGVPYENADLVVSGLDGDQAAAVVERARERGDHASVLGWSLLPLAEDGRRVSDRVEVGALADGEALRWQELRDGTFPGQAGEAVADVNAAKSLGLEVGDRLQVGTGARAADVTLVGLVDTPSASVAADLYLPWDAVAPIARTLYVDSIAYDVAGPADPQVRPLERFSGATVQAADQFVVDRQAEITKDVDIVAIVLLVFATIALFVAVLVIANTFSILFAQRARDFALLRCVGATRRQVLRSVRIEGLVLGLVAAATGVLAGTGTGHLLVAVARDRFDEGTIGEPSPSAGWYLGGLLLGVVATVAASWFPTRRVVAVGPLEALQPAGAVDPRTPAGVVRLAAGVLVLVAGVAALVLAMADHEVPPMLAGGAATFTGVLLLGPVLVPPLVRLAGLVSGRLLGSPGRLAAANAVRNPRRTAATTASLLVGVTLTTAVLTGMATSRTAVDDEMDQSHPVDLTLTSTGAELPATLLDDVLATDGVRAAAALPGTTARVSGIGEVQLLAADRAAVDDVVHGEPAIVVPGPDQVLVPWDSLGAGQAGGDQVRVTVDGTARTLTLRGGDGWGSAAVVAPETLTALTGGAATGTRSVWVQAEDGADPEDLGGDLDALGAPAGAELANGLGERAWVYLQLDVLTASVVALLGIAVVIALIGIGNTLGLSVLERGREHALLRALGLTRRQLRSLLGAEAVLLSVTATLLGTALGIAYAWVGVRTMVEPAVEAATLQLPVPQLVVVVLVAAVAGLLACVLPARRAARTAPAAGLALE
ncbi:ABC transporter permease [Nocardioides caldifontis]|uniref:ABC transporter permease n=1 Tax=Nocardioides caldifontis TaxID=2588938 RepID=UPI0011E020D6|nr:FtsX-like permease family protein [Nocardioides caldifontis]